METRGSRRSNNAQRVYSPAFNSSDAYNRASYRSARLAATNSGYTASNLAVANDRYYYGNTAPAPVRKPQEPATTSQPKKQREWSSLAEYLRKNHVAAKFAISAIVFAFAFVGCFAIIGSVAVAEAQSAFNEVNEQIEELNRQLEELDAEYLFSIDTNAADAAARDMGMTHSAVSTPIHP